MNIQHISIDRARKARYLFAAILLFAGAMTLWVKHSNDVGDQAWGWLFLTGGALFLTYRNYVEIDSASQRLSRRSGFIYGFRFVSFDTAGISRITLSQVHTRRGNRQSRTRFRLVVNSNAEHVLCDLDNMLLARRVAERLCRALRIEFDNQNFGVSSVRSANELDMSLADRWRLRGETKSPPKFGTDSTLVVTVDGDTTSLSAPNRPISWMYMIIVLLVIGAALTWIGSVDETSRLVAYMAGTAVLAVTLLYISGRVGPNVLRVSPTTIEYCFGHSPFRNSLPLAGIEELICTEDEGLYLVTDAGYMVVGLPEEEQERRLQIQFLEHQIAMRQPTAT